MAESKIPSGSSAAAETSELTAASSVKKIAQLATNLTGSMELFDEQGNSASAAWSVENGVVSVVNVRKLYDKFKGENAWVVLETAHQSAFLEILKDVSPFDFEFNGAGRLTCKASGNASDIPSSDGHGAVISRTVSAVKNIIAPKLAPATEPSKAAPEPELEQNLASKKKGGARLEFVDELEERVNMEAHTVNFSSGFSLTFRVHDGVIIFAKEDLAEVKRFAVTGDDLVTAAIKFKLIPDDSFFRAGLVLRPKEKAPKATPEPAAAPSGTRPPEAERSNVDRQLATGFNGTMNIRNLDFQWKVTDGVVGFKVQGAPDMHNFSQKNNKGFQEDFLKVINGQYPGRFFEFDEDGLVTCEVRQVSSGSSATSGAPKPAVGTPKPIVDLAEVERVFTVKCNLAIGEQGAVTKVYVEANGKVMVENNGRAYRDNGANPMALRRGDREKFLRLLKAAVRDVPGDLRFNEEGMLVTGGTVSAAPATVEPEAEVVGSEVVPPESAGDPGDRALQKVRDLIRREGAESVFSEILEERGGRGAGASPALAGDPGDRALQKIRDLIGQKGPEAAFPEIFEEGRLRNMIPELVSCAQNNWRDCKNHDELVTMLRREAERMDRRAFRGRGRTDDGKIMAEERRWTPEERAAMNGRIETALSRVWGLEASRLARLLLANDVSAEDMSGFIQEYRELSDVFCEHPGVSVQAGNKRLRDEAILESSGSDRNLDLDQTKDDLKRMLSGYLNYPDGNQLDLALAENERLSPLFQERSNLRIWNRFVNEAMRVKSTVRDEDSEPESWEYEDFNETLANHRSLANAYQEVLTVLGEAFSPQNVVMERLGEYEDPEESGADNFLARWVRNRRRRNQETQQNQEMGSRARNSQMPADVVRLRAERIDDERIRQILLTQHAGEEGVTAAELEAMVDYAFERADVSAASLRNGQAVDDGIQWVIGRQGTKQRQIAAGLGLAAIGGAAYVGISAIGTGLGTLGRGALTTVRGLARGVGNLVLTVPELAKRTLRRGWYAMKETANFMWEAKFAEVKNSSSEAKAKGTSIRELLGSAGHYGSRILTPFAALAAFAVGGAGGALEAGWGGDLFGKPDPSTEVASNGPEVIPTVSMPSSVPSEAEQKLMPGLLGLWSTANRMLGELPDDLANSGVGFFSGLGVEADEAKDEAGKVIHGKISKWSLSNPASSRAWAEFITLMRDNHMRVPERLSQVLSNPSINSLRDAVTEIAREMEPGEAMSMLNVLGHVFGLEGSSRLLSYLGLGVATLYPRPARRSETNRERDNRAHYKGFGMDIVRSGANAERAYAVLSAHNDDRLLDDYLPVLDLNQNQFSNLLNSMNNGTPAQKSAARKFMNENILFLFGWTNAAIPPESFVVGKAASLLNALRAMVAPGSPVRPSEYERGLIQSMVRVAEFAADEANYETVIAAQFDAAPAAVPTDEPIVDPGSAPANNPATPAPAAAVPVPVARAS